MADNNLRRFTITSSRLQRGLCKGFLPEEKGVLLAMEDHVQRYCFLGKLDSNLEDCSWGRLALKAVLQGDLVLRVRVCASNEASTIYKDNMLDLDEFLGDDTISNHQKEQLFGLMNGKQFDGVTDMLLYGLKGRYLWIWLELSGVGQGRIEDIKVHAPGDNFMQTFPQVYQDEGSFFHRYLSIYSTLYNDMQVKIDNLHQLVNVEQAPLWVLHTLSGWMGLELEGVVSEAEVRKILPIAHSLLAQKGTRICLERILHLFLDVPIFIVESNLLTLEQLESAGGVYPTGVFCCTVMLQCKAEEGLYRKLQRVLEQFIPLRTDLNIVFIEQGYCLNEYTYMDINSTLTQGVSGTMDEDAILGHQVYLQ